MAIRERNRQRGQVLVLFTIALIAIIAMVGLVIDGGATYAQRRGQQNAADLAALAAADALYNGKSQAEATVVAQNVAAINSYATGANGIVVSVTYPGVEVKVDVRAPHQNYFAGVVGQSTWQVATTASAIAGTPDTALGAAPVIMPGTDFGPDAQPLAQYTQANCSGINTDGVQGCIWGDGHHGDVPPDSTAFAWTLYGPNVKTSAVADYLEELGFLHGMSGCPAHTPTVITYATNDYIGQQNQGNHNGAFNVAHCVVGLDVPIPIVGGPQPPATKCNDNSHTDGCFLGWAMFHITGAFKDGNNSHWDGWFLDASNGGGLKYPWLSVTNCLGTSCPPIGNPVLNLVN